MDGITIPTRFTKGTTGNLTHALGPRRGNQKSPPAGRYKTHMENHIENQKSACCKTPRLHGAQCLTCGVDGSGSYNEAILQIPAFIRKRITLGAHEQEVMEQQKEEASLNII